MDDPRALDAWADGLLQPLTPAARRVLGRSIGIALRTSQQARVRDQRNPDGSAYVPRRLRDAAAGRIKRKRDRMFRRIMQARYLKVRTTDAGVSIGFTGRIAQIAAVHQEGQIDAVSPGGTRVRYPIRELLGLTAADRETVRELVIEHLARG